MRSWMILILGFLFLFGGAAQSQVTIGTYTQYVSQYQEDTTGGTNQFDFNPMVGIFYPVELFGVLFKPELGLILFNVESDDEYSKRGYYWIIDAIFPLQTGLELRGGISTFTTRLSGDGGAKDQNNGSSTATFYRPSTSESSSIFALNFGIDMTIVNKNYSLRFETFLNRPFDESRAFSYLLSANAMFF